MKLCGNIVTHDCAKFGELEWEDSRITAVRLQEELREDVPWILPGLIDLHLHGSGVYNVEEGARGIRGMSEFLITRGVTRFLPSYSCAPYEELLEFVRLIGDWKPEDSPGALVAGSHLEGPWLAGEFCGGMIPEMIARADLQQAKEYWNASRGTLKMMTIAPEQPGALEVIRFLREKGVVLSSGHSACPPEFLAKAVEAGITEICHLFDSYPLPEDHGGVRQPALTDLVLIEDRLMKEIIMDGLHVPPELVILARRAAGAEHLIAITDALQGAGLPEGHFLDCGKPYVIREGELARRVEDGQIIGSSLTLNRAFFNMTTRFGFSPVEAVRAAAENPARQLGLQGITGSLQPGLLADITVLGPDRLQVLATYLGGALRFQQK